jgi:sigma-B regulation protein RsbU (phosphoserine phosphatase)
VSFSPELLYEQAACGLMLVDRDGFIRRVNHTFCEWLGYGAPSLLAGIKLQDLLTVGARAFHQTHWHPMMQLQGAVSEVKLAFRHRDGRKMPMLVNARALTVPGDEVLHSISISPAWERDRYERELLRTKAEALALLQERAALQQEATDRGRFAEQLIGIVSHDLRNPLTAIRMGAEMLAFDELDAKRVRYTVRINQSVDRAMTLVEDLLDFTLAKTGRALAIVKSDIDLHDVVASAVEELSWSFPELAIEHRTDGPGAVYADAERLKRVLGNLVANAARYGDTSRPVSVTSQVEKGIARIAVTNQGLPISRELVPVLFEAMTRGDPLHGGGVGLGLYIVNQIARAHGGQPSVRSEHATGTCVAIEFPVLAASAADE